MGTETKKRMGDFVGAEVSPELKRRIRIGAARENMTISEYLRQTLDEVAPDG